MAVRPRGDLSFSSSSALELETKSMSSGAIIGQFFSQRQWPTYTIGGNPIGK